MAPSKRREPPADNRQLEFDILFDAMPDVAMRDQRDAMERPFVNLSKLRRIEPIIYKNGDIEIRVLPHSEFGWASIWDWDVIIYLLGQVTKQLNGGKSFEQPAIVVQPAQLLAAIGRGTGGKDYEALRAGIARLQTTVIETNVMNGKVSRRFERFTLIHRFVELEPTPTSSGGMHFVLPDWLVAAAKDRGVLSINPAYFGITSGYERFLYRMARKLCGHQVSAEMKMATLLERSGSPSRLADFAKKLRAVVERNGLPDYLVRLRTNEQGEEIVVFTQRPLAIERSGTETPMATAG